MAVMGVRVNSGGGFGIDTGVADVFAKALFGDPEREMKLALARSDLATDEYQRRQIQSVIDRNAALEALDKYKLSGMQGAEPAIARIIRSQDYTGGSSGTTTAAPAPVEVPIPVPTPRPSPVSGANAPAPVEIRSQEPD